MNQLAVLQAGGQTGAATVMVAERAAEILLRGAGGSADLKEPELAMAWIPRPVWHFLNGLYWGYPWCFYSKSKTIGSDCFHASILERCGTLCWWKLHCNAREFSETILESILTFKLMTSARHGNSLGIAFMILSLIHDVAVTRFVECEMIWDMPCLSWSSLEDLDVACIVAWVLLASQFYSCAHARWIWPIIWRDCVITAV